MGEKRFLFMDFFVFFFGDDTHNTHNSGFARCCGDKLRPLLGRAGVLASRHSLLQPLRTAAPVVQRHEHLEHERDGATAGIFPPPIPGQ